MAEESKTTMQACYYEKYGPAEQVLKVGPLPVPEIEGPHDVLVKVHAAAINPADFKQTEGELRAIMNRPFPIKPGFDFSGVVMKKGEAVEHLNEGDEVFGMIRGLRTGTTAEYIVVDDHVISKKPASISHKEAAAVPLAAITALQCLEKVGFTYPPGDNSSKSLFLTGGPGGVGTFVIQLAKRVFKIGTVVTTASTAKVSLCQSWGADEVVDYKKVSFTEALKGRSFDGCVDLTGETSSMLPFVKPGGGLCTITANITGEMLREWLSAAGPHPGFKPLGVVKSALFTIPPGVVNLFTGAAWNRHRLAAGATFHSIITVPSKATLDIIAKHVENGDVKVILDQVFPLEKAVDAYLRVKSGAAVGKVVVEVVQ